MKSKLINSLALALLGTLASTFASAQTLIVFNNLTGLPDDAIYITLQGGSSPSGLFGGGSAINDNQSYSLAQLTSSTGLSVSGYVTAPNLNITNYQGGVIQMTAGQTVGSTTPGYSLVNGRFEVNIQQGNLPANNVDISYVNNISMPSSFSVRLQSDGSLATLPGQLNHVNTTSGSTIFSNLAAAVPSQAIIPAGGYNVYAASNPSTPIGTITGTASVLSPLTQATGYNSWLTPDNGTSPTANALIPYLTNTGATLNVSSYTVSSGTYLPGALFGFSTVPAGSGGALPQSPFNLNGNNNDPTNSFLQGQTYNMTAQFSTDLNPGGSNTNLTAQGITAGTAGVKITGTGTAGNGTGPDGNAVGTFSIYITNSNLDSPTGIYGNNPTYTVEWNGNYVTTSNTNSLVDRAVGDLLAGITFGWAGSDTTIGAHATATGTASYLVGTVFGAGGADENKQIKDLPTGEYFYLLSLMAQGGGTALANWVGSGIDLSTLFYDVYGSAIAADTDAYTFPYSDRIQGSSPDIYYTPPSTSYTTSDVYIQIDLLPGGYTFNSDASVPEPSTWAMLLGGLGALLFWQRRKSRA